MCRRALASAALLAIGCNAHPLVESGPLRTASEKTTSRCARLGIPVDILLVIDDSPSMADEAEVLQQQLDGIADVYEREGSRIDYRIAVTTTDTGNPRCDPTTRDDGALVATSCRERLTDFITGPSIENDAVDLRTTGCLRGCELGTMELLPTAVEPGGERRPRPWIEREQGVRNIPPTLDLRHALRCMVPQGVSGCAFESPLEAARQAILRSFDPTDRAYGFLRPDAALFVLFITDEQDCSARPEHGDIFEPAGDRVFWSDRDADEPTSAVCFNAGVHCSGESGVYDDCWPTNRGADGELTDGDGAVLEPVATYGWFFRQIELEKQERGINQSQRVFVRVLGGVGEHGQSPGESPGYYDATDPAIQTAFGIGPGCLNPTEDLVAYPPFRLDALADAFAMPSLPTLYSMCSTSWAEAAACVPGSSSQLWPFCFEGCVADADPGTPDVLEPECRVEETFIGPGGSQQRVALPRCDGATNEVDETCWEPLTGPADMSPTCVDAGYNLEVQLRRASAAPGQSCIEVTCTTSERRLVDCPNMPS